jgi:hypothetical protein
MYTYKDEFEVGKSTNFFFSKQEWEKIVTWMYTCIYDFYQNNSWNKCEEKMKSMWKKKLEVISFLHTNRFDVDYHGKHSTITYLWVGAVNGPLIVITYLSFQTFSPWLCCCPSSLQTYQRFGHGNSNP